MPVAEGGPVPEGGPVVDTGPIPEGGPVVRPGGKRPVVGPWPRSRLFPGAPKGRSVEICWPSDVAVGNPV